MSKPFDPDEYLMAKGANVAEAPSFDPDTYLTDKALETADIPTVGAGETFLNRSTDAIPLGKQISNVGTTAGLQLGKLLGVGEPSARLTPKAKAELEAMGETVHEGNAIPGVLDTYRDVRDTRDLRTAAGSEQNPWAARFGTGTGIALSLLAPLPKFAPKGADAAGRVAAGAKTGAAYGGLMSLANGRADLTRGEVGEALKDTSGVQGLQDAYRSAKEGRPLDTLLNLAGAGVIGGGALGYGIGKAADPVSDLLKKLALNRGRRAIQGSSDIAAATRKPLSDEAVQEALDSGLVKPLSTTRGIYKNLDAAADRQGAILGKILDDLEAAGVKGPKAKELADQMLQRYDDTFHTSGANKAVPETYIAEGQNFTDVTRGQTNLGLRQAEAIKSNLQKQARYDRLNNSLTEEAKQEIASTLRQATEDAVEQAGNAASAGSKVKDLAQSFVPAKQKAARLYEALTHAERGAAKAAQRQGVSLKDSVLGAATGNPLTAYMTATAGSALRGIAPSTIAAYANRLAKGGASTGLPARAEALDNASSTLSIPIERMGRFAAPLAAAAARGQAALMAAHYVLSKRDPEYLKQLELAQAAGP